MEILFILVVLALGGAFIELLEVLCASLAGFIGLGIKKLIKASNIDLSVFDNDNVQLAISIAIGLSVVIVALLWIIRIIR
jgi:uncharacterized membrane protein